MARRMLLSLLLMALFATPGCIKRIPASAGGDRKVVAGHPVTLGEPAEVPEGARVAWNLGDGTELGGPQIQHAWHRPGRFEVRVTVTDPDGQERQDAAFVEVTRPALLDVVPAGCGSMVLFHQPGERLSQVPLFLERLVASGQDANSLLAAVREQAGFDPFSPEGWRAAGLDPTGGLALVGDEAGDELLVVASLLPGDTAHKTLRAFLVRASDAKEQPSQSDGGVIEVRSLESGELLAAFTDFRGHLWVAVPSDDKSSPVQRLIALRQAGVQPGLGGHPAYVQARQTREALGAMHLYVSGERVRSQVPAGEAGGEPVERGIRESLREEMTYLRGDLDVAPKSAAFELRAGLKGARITQFSKVLQARNAVPAFRTLLTPGRHLILKVSADWFGLIQALGDLGEDAEMWRRAPEALDTFDRETETGIAVRKDLVENLGDSFLVAIRLKLTGLLGLAGQQKDRSISDLLGGVVLIQLRDGDRFFAALDALDKLEVGLDDLVADHSGDERWWKVGPPDLGLVLTPGPGMAILATTREQAEAARAQLAAPRKTGRWPAEIEHPAHQVLAADLAGLVEDFERTPSPPNDASAAVAKGMLAMGLAKLGKLDGLMVDAELQESGVRVTFRLTCQ